jgi:hypothetical protein
MQYVIPTTAYPAPVTGLVSINPEYKRTQHTHTHTHTSVTNHPNAVLMHKAAATGTPRVWGLTSYDEQGTIRHRMDELPAFLTFRLQTDHQYFRLHSSFLLHFIRLYLSSTNSRAVSPPNLHLPNLYLSLWTLVLY